MHLRTGFLQAIEFGANEEVAKKLLKKIRKKEFPDSMYAHFSRDDFADTSDDSVKQIIEKLDDEFDLSLNRDEESFIQSVRESMNTIRPQIKEVLSGVSSEVRMDLGIAFFEMGLFEEAEHIFENTIDESGQLSLDALYLAAESRVQRGDYVQAVTLLHKICKNPDRLDEQNLAVYYLLGESYEAMNQKKRSQRYFKKAADIDLNYRDLKGKLE